MKKFDAKLIDIVQNAYLWVWDRTGIYVSTLLFILYVGDHFFWAALKWFDFIFLAWAGLWCSYLYVVQSKDLRRLNDDLRQWRDFAVRPYLMILSFSIVMVDVLSLNAWHLASDICWLGWGYLACIQVRDREPKEFFPASIPRPA